MLWSARREGTAAKGGTKGSSRSSHRVVGIRLQYFALLLCKSPDGRVTSRTSIDITSPSSFLCLAGLPGSRRVCASLSSQPHTRCCWRFESILDLSSQEAQYRRRRGLKRCKLHHSIVAEICMRRRSIWSLSEFVASTFACTSCSFAILENRSALVTSRALVFLPHRTSIDLIT
jgi:hypothetical protein